MAGCNSFQKIITNYECLHNLLFSAYSNRRSL
ncbi:hypothetical protein RUMOBE_03342 [Blautia obeum ATCC 29174]|uniref:Uncharacterized protein n=1 Tax=Blautia obeum ATCC 29174 TaxID=411459 RepID=A5ZWE9_9FIRM|nr:hypothetical protein RUMOBE_03342 [Blautia obeum ATCC 29174]